MPLPARLREAAKLGFKTAIVPRRIRRGHAKASFVMDHGRFGPQGALGGRDGACNEVTIRQGDRTITPDHLSKAQDIPLMPGDRVRVRPGERIPVDGEVVIRVGPPPTPAVEASEEEILRTVERWMAAGG